MHHPHAKPGFTIIEVLISIAIALLLILGINQVFSIAQQTTGAGTVTLAQVENARGAAAIMQRDFNSAVTGSDSPGIVIISEPVYAFRNRQDMLNSSNPTRPDLQDNPVPGNPPIQENLTMTNSRVHRIDRIMFFTRNVSRRQSPAAMPPVSNDLVSNTAWLESYVWYGHLALPINPPYPNPFNPTDAQFRTYFGPRAGYPTPLAPRAQALPSDFRNPGDGGPNVQQATTFNPNNYFASDWILGRMPMLLIPFPTSIGINNSVAPQAPFEVTMTGSPPGPASPTDPNVLSILSARLPGAVPAQPAQAVQAQGYNNTGAVVTGTAPGTTTLVPLYSSIYDQALTSIDSYRQVVGGDVYWWSRLSGWSFGGLNVRPQDIRFEANPIPQRPPPSANLTPTQVAQWLSVANARQAPIFLRNCSQFIVEYAGDFLTQDNNPTSPTFGNAFNVGPDGEIDYIVQLINGQRTKRIRWYGFPRDVSGILGPPDGHVNWQYDVVPLRDVIVNSPNMSAARQAQAFERTLLQTNGNPTGTVTLPMPGSGDYAANGAVPPGAQYVCAWGADLSTTPKPKMIRITIALDDPSGRLNNEQYFEYVFNLP